jgi:hypothetical protein
LTNALIENKINQAISSRMVKQPRFLPQASKSEESVEKTKRKPEKEKDISDYFNLNKFH